MAPVWTVFLLLAVGVQAQSGDSDSDAESGIRCRSHITLKRNSLTCELLPHADDDDDDDEDEGDAIEAMTLCFFDWSEKREKCVKDDGNTLSFTKASVFSPFNLTAHLKRGGAIWTRVSLMKIVQPRPPRVWNVTLDPESNQAVVHIQSPYHGDLLTGNQMLQLHIWTTATHMVQNTSSESSMKIDMEHLRENTQYHVAARALPVNPLGGSWSDWSHTVTFFTPAGRRETKLYTVMLCLVPLVVVSVIVVFLWKNRILTSMWPSIPQPKDTLVHIGKPHKGLLLNFNPEVFSALRVSSKPESVFRPADGAPPTHPCSAQSSDCRSTTSASTEELDLSALLSGSSSGAGASLRSAGPPPAGDLLPEGGAEPGSGGSESEAVGGGQQEEAYVTMSSFHGK